MITEKINAKNEFYVNKILKEDSGVKPPSRQNEYKDMINKWKAQSNKSNLKETLNLIHVKDTKLIKRDLERGIKIIEDNTVALAESDGFKTVGKKIGIDSNSIFASRSQAKFMPITFADSQNKARSQSYLELKNMREQEKADKLKQIQENYEKIKMLNQTRSERIGKMKNKIQQKEQKMKEKEEIESENLEKWKEERATKIKEMKENMKRQQEERLMQKRKTDLEVQKLKQGPLLYKSINEKFQSTVEAENLKKK